MELQPLAREKYEAIRNEAIKLQSHLLGQLPETDREIFLEQLETIAGACRDLSNPQRKP